MILCCKTLDTVRHIIQRNAEKGLLPNYTHGIVNMKSQYNTIGILGIYEVLVHYGMTETDKFGYVYYTDEGIEFAKQILKTITDVKNEFQSNVDYSINIEQVPAERAAAERQPEGRGARALSRYPPSRANEPQYPAYRCGPRLCRCRPPDHGTAR